nr:endonuclease NucS [Methylomonas sp. DH-1]
MSERNLEELVRKHCGLIEEGMSYISHQNWLPNGRLDVLLIDSGKSLVVGELKVVEDDAMLMQCLDYYDHVNTGIETYARMHPDYGIDPAQPVRMLLMAPSFSQALINRCKWLDVNISLFTYSCLELEGSKQLVPVFSEQSIPSVLEAPIVHRQDDRLNYITDPGARALATSAIKEIKDMWQGRTSVDPLKYAISMKVDGRVVAYLHPRRKNFLISTYNADEKWTPYPIQSDDDLATVQRLIRDHVERRSKNG